jgi:lipoprotein signal peptidase
VWLPVVVLGVVRQWIEYGVWSALIFVALLALFLVLLLRLLAAKDRPGRTLDLLGLLFGFAAAASLTSAPFANTSTHGTGVAFSRHTALGSAAVSAIAAAVCWLLARRAGWRKRRATELPS